MGSRFLSSEGPVGPYESHDQRWNLALMALASCHAGLRDLQARDRG
jgi:hypothetical protein